MQVKWVPLFGQFRLGSVLSDDWEEGLVTQGLIYQWVGFGLRVLEKPDLEFTGDKVLNFSIWDRWANRLSRERSYDYSYSVWLVGFLLWGLIFRSPFLVRGTIVLFLSEMSWLFCFLVCFFRGGMVFEEVRNVGSVFQPGFSAEILIDGWRRVFHHQLNSTFLYGHQSFNQGVNDVYAD